MGTTQIRRATTGRLRRSVLIGAVVAIALTSAACSSNDTTKTAAQSPTSVGQGSSSSSSTSTPAAGNGAAGGSSTTTASGSAAGQNCVAMVGPLPSGAPDVPVVVGPAPTTLVIKDLREGTGATVAAGSTVTVNYIGVACTTGKIFDSSYTTGQPVTFGLNQVIKGWTDGLPGMKVGGSRLLGIPSSQAYGNRSPSPDIGPNEPLWFVVELTAVK